MTVSKKIVVCDDEGGQASRWKVGLEGLLRSGDFEVMAFSLQEFQDSLRALEQRRRDLRSPNKEPTAVEDQRASREATPFDEATVLIVDWDLYDFEWKNTRIDGGQVAYLARCYSKCRYIIGVNIDKVGDPFDLSLVDHPAQFIDLSIGSNQVTHAGLWHDSGTPGGFHPWSWPLVLDSAQRLAERSTALASKLDVSLREVLDLPGDLLTALPRELADYLEVPGQPDALEVTVRDWVSTSRSGIARKDVLADDDAIARVAAARLLKWYEAVLVPTQEQLIDAPHLAEKRPGLLHGDSTNPSVWAATTCRGTDGQSGLRDEVIDAFRWRSPWASRPLWDWPALQQHAPLGETRRAPRPTPSLVFAEDVGAFVDAKTATRFVAAVPGANRVRYIARPADAEHVAYIPSRRLSIVT